MSAAVDKTKYEDDDSRLASRPGVPSPVPAVVGGGDAVPNLKGDGVTPAFEQLFDLYAGGIHRYLASRAGAQVAEDLVSETFLAALRNRDTFDPVRGTPQVWLFGIATNLLRNQHRSEVRHLAATTRHLGQAGEDVTADDGAEGRLDAAAAVKRLVPDLLRLEGLDRDILLLNTWAGLTLVEIAAALNMPAGTVRSRLHRLRRDLRAAISAQADTFAEVTLLRAEVHQGPSLSGDLT